MGRREGWREGKEWEAERDTAWILTPRQKRGFTKRWRGAGGRQRQRQTDRHGDREVDREGERERDRQAGRDKDRPRERVRDSKRDRDRERRDRDRLAETERERARERGRKTDEEKRCVCVGGGGGGVEGAEDLPRACSQVVRADPSSDVQVGVVHLVHVVTHGQLKDVHRALRHAVSARAQAGHRPRVAVAHACKQFVW